MIVLELSIEEKDKAIRGLKAVLKYSLIQELTGSYIVHL